MRPPPGKVEFHPRTPVESNRPLLHPIQSRYPQFPRQVPISKLRCSNAPRCLTLSLYLQGVYLSELAADHVDRRSQPTYGARLSPSVGFSEDSTCSTRRYKSHASKRAVNRRSNGLSSLADVLPLEAMAMATYESVK
jgi:hypothetical protein